MQQNDLPGNIYSLLVGLVSKVYGLPFTHMIQPGKYILSASELTWVSSGRFEQCNMLTRWGGYLCRGCLFFQNERYYSILMACLDHRYKWCILHTLSSTQISLMSARTHTYTSIFTGKSFSSAVPLCPLSKCLREKMTFLCSLSFLLVNEITSSDNRVDVFQCVTINSETNALKLK